MSRTTGKCSPRSNQRSVGLSTFDSHQKLKPPFFKCQCHGSVTFGLLDDNSSRGRVEILVYSALSFDYDPGCRNAYSSLKERTSRSSFREPDEPSASSFLEFHRVSALGLAVTWRIERRTRMKPKTPRSPSKFFHPLYHFSLVDMRSIDLEDTRTKGTSAVVLPLPFSGSCKDSVPEGRHCLEA